MILRYNNKEIKLVNCKSFYSRLRGFMLCKNIDKALLFEHCNSIHTFFMYEKIDVIMCNKDNIVLYYYKDLDKNKVIFPKKNVSRVYELPVGYFNIKINDRLEIK